MHAPVRGSQLSNENIKMGRGEREEREGAGKGKREEGEGEKCERIPIVHKLLSLHESEVHGLWLHPGMGT